MTSIIASIGMIATLFFAWWIDRWIEDYEKTIIPGGQGFVGFIWAHVLANLLIISLLLFLAWLVAFRRGRNRFIAALYLIVGGLLVLFPAMHYSLFTLPAFNFVITPQTGPLRFALLGTGMVSRFAMANAFTAVTGLAGLFLHVKTIPTKV